VRVTGGSVAVDPAKATARRLSVSPPDQRNGLLATTVMLLFHTVTDSARAGGVRKPPARRTTPAAAAIASALRRRRQPGMNLLRVAHVWGAPGLRAVNALNAEYASRREIVDVTAQRVATADPNASVLPDRGHIADDVDGVPR